MYLQACANRFNYLSEVKAQEPKPKEFVNSFVASTINEYFGGNTPLLIEALGKTSSYSPNPKPDQLIVSIDRLESAVLGYISRELGSLEPRLKEAFLELAVLYCTLWEGRGRPPTRSFFDSRYFYQEICKFLGADPQKDQNSAWGLFSATVGQATEPARLQ